MCCAANRVSVARRRLECVLSLSLDAHVALSPERCHPPIDMVILRLLSSLLAHLLSPDLHFYRFLDSDEAVFNGAGAAGCRTAVSRRLRMPFRIVRLRLSLPEAVGRDAATRHPAH
ncbi:hypothetical protein, conserved [Leishmania donovani]|uniref:Uncharacterized protein n=1 Tax=Leishmania donovani TaxID=5661 RepID=E9BMI9_LEIDO|nr:hypothetical protein, conserved [Leishmania donovani]CBZ36467.1 hypothetical protein, conserved [Leishmania donovani]